MAKGKKKQLPISLLQEHPSPEKFSYGHFILSPPPPLKKIPGSPSIVYQVALQEFHKILQFRTCPFM